VTQILQGFRVLEVAQWWFVPSARAARRDWGVEIMPKLRQRLGIDVEPRQSGLRRCEAT
jgi:hypothetical protein